MKHSDCSNFAPVDCAKGICRLVGTTIYTDTETCPSFKEAPKCRNCSNFKDVDAAGTGTCLGFPKKAWTYEELNAITCESYAVAN